MSTPRQRYFKALTCFDDVVARIGGEQWERPSACPPWSVRELTGHVIDGQRQVLRMLRREPPVAPVRTSAGLGGVAGDDPASTWRHVRDETIATLADVDDAAVVLTPMGNAPVAELLATAVVEPLLHAWDLATSVGDTADLDPETVEATLAGVEALGEQLAASGMYAPARPVQEGMIAEERLLALTGRG